MPLLTVQRSIHSKYNICHGESKNPRAYQSLALGKIPSWPFFLISCSQRENCWVPINFSACSFQSELHSRDKPPAHRSVCPRGHPVKGKLPGQATGCNLRINWMKASTEPKSSVLPFLHPGTNPTPLAGSTWCSRCQTNQVWAWLCWMGDCCKSTANHSELSEGTQDRISSNYTWGK